MKQIMGKEAARGRGSSDSASDSASDSDSDSGSGGCTIGGSARAKRERRVALDSGVFKGQEELLGRDHLPEELHALLIKVLSAFGRPNLTVQLSKWFDDSISALLPDVDADADELAGLYRVNILRGMADTEREVKERGGRVPRWLKRRGEICVVLGRLGARVLLARAKAGVLRMFPSGIPDAPQLDFVGRAKGMISEKYAGLDDSKVFAQFFILAGLALGPEGGIASRFAALEADGRFQMQPDTLRRVAGVNAKATVLGCRRDLELPGHCRVRILVFEPGQESAGVVVYAQLPDGTTCGGLHAALLAHADGMTAYAAFLTRTFQTHAICKAPDRYRKPPPEGRRMIELTCMGEEPLPARLHSEMNRLFLVAVRRSDAVVQELDVQVKAACLLIRRKHKRNQAGVLRGDAVDSVFRQVSLTCRLPIGRSSVEPLHGMLQAALPEGYSIPPFSDAGWRFARVRFEGPGYTGHRYIEGYRGQLDACLEPLHEQFSGMERRLLNCIEQKRPLIVARYSAGTRIEQPPSATEPRSITEHLTMDGDLLAREAVRSRRRGASPGASASSGASA